MPPAVQPPMIPFEEALQIVLSVPVEYQTERIGLENAAGRILAEEIRADMDMPPFDKSAVDGYACRLADAVAGRQLEVMETVAAGRLPGHTVSEGRCSKIMTGAMLPPGAECVVMVEYAEPSGPDHIRIEPGNPGINVCYRGEDIRSGQTLLSPGKRIKPADIAVLASMGSTQPRVATLPLTGILSTGDELVEPAARPGPAQIRNSNAWQLISQVKSVPAEPAYYGIVPDRAEALRDAIQKGLDETRLLLLTGGVSMGEFDLVPGILRECGVDILFKSVAIQPGRPTLFGRSPKGFVFGLPGNPVSSFVIFEVLVRPLLLRMMGCNEPLPVWNLPLGQTFTRKRAARQSLIPVKLLDGVACPVEYHGSAHINAYSYADGIMTVERGTERIEKGTLVHVRPV